ncbi:hypothetical protein T10_4575 [Trichinella papuae]|uniref:Uncharacterized protein n=1 Tax=Trichinella papuae TaxID=268474 RepID=A0A0V1N387_9BILA|nr:hypothetical protein T10_4575 [Trichinella papuae]
MVSWAFHGPMVAGDALRDSLTSLDRCPAGFSDPQPCFTASPVQLGRDAREYIFELPAIGASKITERLHGFQKSRDSTVTFIICFCQSRLSGAVFPEIRCFHRAVYNRKPNRKTV